MLNKVPYFLEINKLGIGSNRAEGPAFASINTTTSRR